MPTAPERTRRRWPAWLDDMRARCDVCGQPLGAHGYYIQEEPEAPEPRQGWTLCSECSEAVWQHVEQLALPVARRLRVAVGLVASERASPEALRSRTPDAVRDRRAERRTQGLLI